MRAKRKMIRNDCSQLPAIVNRLIDRGVKMPDPGSVFFADDVAVERIAPGVTLHPGCRISGAKTSVGPGCVLGEEAPVTLSDSQLGRGVRLKGGFFSGMTALEDVSFGSCGHVRPSTLLEESASCAHAVGLKQTLLLPGVTLGSLINFCDCLMAGGTGGKNHSEVGSSYVHFNYTPHGDKATPSLFGDVPRGVMLDQEPIFLGGQGGAAGPIRMEYGVVTAAGVICRMDLLAPGRLLYESPSRGRSQRKFHRGLYGDIGRAVGNNMIYLGNLIAMKEWYRHVRVWFMKNEPFSCACYDGALRALDGMIQERMKRMDELAENMDKSICIAGTVCCGNSAKEPYRSQRRFAGKWPSAGEQIARKIYGSDEFPALRGKFLRNIEHAKHGSSYVERIGSLTPAARAAGSAWLQAEVDAVASLMPEL